MTMPIISISITLGQQHHVGGKVKMVLVCRSDRLHTLPCNSFFVLFQTGTRVGRTTPRKNYGSRVEVVLVNLKLLNKGIAYKCVRNPLGVLGVEVEVQVVRFSFDSDCDCRETACRSRFVYFTSPHGVVFPHIFSTFNLQSGGNYT
jgi:hypothetical protein